MNTHQLIDAIASGDSVEIQSAFDACMSSRIVERLDAMRQDVAQNMFKEAIEEVNEEELALEDYSLEEIEEFMQTEEYEQLDELSKKTLVSYLDKAEDSYLKTKDPKVKAKRDAGLGRAEDKLETKLNSGNPFKKEEVELDEADSKVHPDAVHVQHVGNGKYKVHAVGKNFANGIKSGEHLSDSELDDFREMGGKVKNVK